VTTGRLLLVRFGALFAWLGAYWAGARSIVAWRAAASDDPTASTDLVDLLGSTSAALICLGACGWCLVLAMRGYRAHREARSARDRRSLGEALHERAYEPALSSTAHANAGQERSEAR
jgi:hypothetical protein